MTALPEPACRLASSRRPRGPLDGPRRPPGAQDGPGQASWRSRRPLDGPPGAKQAFDACAGLSVLLCLHDNSLDETSVR